MYAVIVEPPFDVGAVYVTVAVVLPVAVAVPMPGAVGIPGVTADDAADGAEVEPALVVAVTVNV